MSLEKNFCPSPWFHMRINNTGNYEYCRWAVKDTQEKEITIKNTSPVTWFQQNLSEIRLDMLAGNEIVGCQLCQQMEQHGKVSGRQRQLLKTGVRVEDFVPAMKSSPWLPVFTASQRDGTTDQLPQDWQIDLGNYCNSACLFCSPYSSSRIASEQKVMGIIKELPPRAWCDDPVLLNQFIETLQNTPKLAYLHFIGGETLITPAFKKILTALIDTGIHQQTSIGFTVNLTVWRQDIVELLTQFKEVNLGMSIECFHPVNDYARYGGQLDATTKILEDWLTVARQHNWLTSLRTTPTILTALHLDTVYKYAHENQLFVESCNFLTRPDFMRPTVLPKEYRDVVIKKLMQFSASPDEYQIVNTRNSHNGQRQLQQDAQSYINYLSTAEDESYRLPDLVKYLKRMESVRKNSVLDYLPEYEELFRSAGY